MTTTTAIETPTQAGFDTDQYKQIVSDLLAQAKKLGATAAEAGVSGEAGLSVTVRMGEVETLEHNRDKGLGLTVYFGKHKGSASTTDFNPKAISETVKAACDIARYTQEDEFAGLAEAKDMATQIPELDLYHPWHLAVDNAIEMARTCEEAARAEDTRISNSEGATVSSHDGVRVYGNTHGFIGGYERSRHSVSCAVIAQDEKGMQRDDWYSVCRDPDALEAVEAVGAKAAQRTVARLGAHKLTTCQVPVLFSAEVAKGLLGHLLRGISGRAQYRKSTFLLDQMGQAIFPSRIRIDERPHLPKALGSTPFDDEGVATQPRDWIRDGVLQGYVLDSYAARRLGMQATGNASGVHNLYINHDDQSLAALMRQMGKGLLVTEVMGQGVNTVTGDYSRGASGFWIEDGEIQYPVDEITLAGRLQDMYRNLQAVGNDVDTRGNICTGSWLLSEMTVAGE